MMAKQFQHKSQSPALAAPTAAPDEIGIAREIYTSLVISQGVRTIEPQYLADKSLELAEVFIDAVANRELAREIAHDKASDDESAAAAELASPTKSLDELDALADLDNPDAKSTPPKTTKTG